MKGIYAEIIQIIIECIYTLRVQSTSGISHCVVIHSQGNVFLLCCTLASYISYNFFFLITRLLNASILQDPQSSGYEEAKKSVNVSQSNDLQKKWENGKEEEKCRNLITRVLQR